MSLPKTVYIGSDHAAFDVKKNLLERLKKTFPTIQFQDLGSHDDKSVDYPDFAKVVGQKVVAENAKGVLLCGSGIGMCITANKVKGVRAASAWDVTSAKLSRLHNDANVICLGARLTGPEVIFEMCSVWLQTDFLGDRHQKRIDKITQMEG